MTIYDFVQYICMFFTIYQAIVHVSRGIIKIARFVSNINAIADKLKE